MVAIRRPERRVLEDIRRDVRALLEGPWHAGDLCLGRVSDARRWFGKAYASAAQAQIDLEQATRLRRDHQQFVHKARDTMHTGFARHVLTGFPGVFRAAYDFTFLPERLGAIGVLMAYEQVVLKNQNAQRAEQELRDVQTFLDSLSGAGLSSAGAPGLRQ